MDISELRSRVEFGRYTSGVNEYGDPAPKQWEPVVTLWASVEGLRGMQYFTAQQAVEQADHRIMIRWRRDIRVGMVAKHDGRVFTVQAALDRTGRREYLELICREVRPV